MAQREQRAGGAPAGIDCLSHPGDERCVPWIGYVDELVELAGEAPLDRYVQGQAVFALVRAGAYDAALAVAESCVAEVWWCHALRGHVLAETDRIVDAEAAFDAALRAMPDDDLCEWTDVSLFLTGGAWSRYRGDSCRERLALSHEFWWLVDPAWSIDGNDRKVEHYNRMVWATLHDDALTGETGDGHVDDGVGHTTSHHPEVLRYGIDADARDGISGPPPGQRGFGVIPEQDALVTPFQAGADAWRIELNSMAEQYVPAWGSPVALEEFQVAFFDRGDAIIATAAVRVPADRAFQDDAVLLLGAGPDAPPVRAMASTRRGETLVFRAVAPRGRYVVGIEARAAGGIARLRFGHGLPNDAIASGLGSSADPGDAAAGAAGTSRVTEATARGPGALRVSDLLLFTPDGRVIPDSLDAAVPLMQGTHRWTRQDSLGVFLEVYGPESTTTVPIAIELEPKRGWLARVGEAIGIGGDSPVNTSWTQPGSGGLYPVSFTIDLREVDAGDYTLRVTVGAPRDDAVVVENEVRVEDGG